MSVRFAFDNSYGRLPERFYAALSPSPVAAPRLVRLNAALAETLGLDAEALAAPEGVAVLAGNVVPDGAASIALAYAGHQFGNFTPQLGDGRAILLGEVLGRDGARRDIQWKGSGPTPFSRGGDGRAALGPVLREYLISEAMAALGIPTTRALAAVTTGEEVFREEPLPGAVLLRVASSHLRVGTFQFFAARGDTEALRALADYAIARHDPAAATEENPYRALLEGVVARQAELVARWLLVGFIHGVMNTDNTTISGETIDFGPCAFMDEYDIATVFSSIDRNGRYAYGNQPRIAFWNMCRFAETLLPLLDADEKRAVEIAQEAVGGFGPVFEATYRGGLRRKIGLTTDREGDDALTQALLDAMAENRADFTLMFRGLGAAVVGDDIVREQFIDPTQFDAWAMGWRDRLGVEDMEPAARRAAMDAVNPAVIPRNHLVESALNAAVTKGDFAPFEELHVVLAEPFSEPADKRYTQPPAPDERVLRTFCGT